MRFPNLAQTTDLLVAWGRMIVQYEKDYSALEPYTEDVTLDASTTSTTFSSEKIRATSNVVLTPKTANASAEFGNGTIYINTPSTGAIVINHANNAQTDRIYRITVLGT